MKFIGIQFLLFLLFDSFFVFSQNEIIEVSSNIGMKGTVIKIIGKENWNKHSSVYFGSSVADTIIVSNRTLYATVGNGATGTITVLDPEGGSCIFNNFIFTYYPRIVVTGVYSDISIDSNEKKTKLIIIGTGLSGLTNVKIGELTIKIGEGLVIVSDSKAFINLPIGLTIKNIVFSNPIESIDYKY